MTKTLLDEQSLPPRAYRIYRPANWVEGAETRGQVWAGESVAENIALCDVQTILPVFLKYLPKAGRISESGCGLGRWVFYLRERGYDVSGIDLAQSAVAQAKTFDPSAPIFVDDVTNSQFPDSSFDAAISLGVVEHFEEGPQCALDELRRLLKPGGVLLISVPIQNLFRRLLTHRLKDLFLWYRTKKGASFVFEEYRYNRTEFQARLEASGFNVLEVVPDDFLPPKNLGLYADVKLLRGHHAKWELNMAGNLLVAVLRAISDWSVCAGALWVCKRVPD